MHQRTALGAGEDRFVDGFGVLLLAEDQPAPGAPQSLVGGGGHHVGVGDGILMAARRHQPRDMGHIHHELCPAGVGDLPEFLKVNGPGVGAGPGYDQLGLLL